MALTAGTACCQHPSTPPYCQQLIALEGGWHDDPVAGPTKYGISAHAHPGLRHRIRNLTAQEACRIYRDRYYRPMRVDQFPRPLRFAFLEAGVHHGPRRATELLQSALQVEEDGIVGEKTLAAARRQAPHAVLNRFYTRRAMIYARSPHFNRFGRGWLSRLFHTHRWTQLPG